MIGGASHLGLSQNVGRIKLAAQGERITFTAGKRQWRARAVGPQIPLRLRASSTQQLNGEWVRVPFEIKGRARLAFSGRRLAVVLESFEMVVHPPFKVHPPLK
jgi:hypothetical protein